MFERCLYFNLNSLTRDVNRIWDEAFGRVGLSPPHAYLMRAVFTEPGITPKRLATELKLSSSTVTRFLDAMAGRGLLERRQLSKDGRELAIYPTKEGKKIKHELEKVAATLFQQIRHNMNEAAVESLVLSLREAKAALKQAPESA